MDDKQARRQINLLLAGTFLFWFSMYTYPSFLSAYAQEDLGASPVMIGLIVGSYGFTQMLLRIPLGLCSDMTGRRRPFLILGMAAAMAGAAGLALVNTSMGALVFRALFGVGMGLIIPLTMSGAIVNIPHEKRGAAMGFYQSVYGVGMFLGPLLAGWVVERFSAGGDMVRGYSANFYLCAAISLLGLVVAIFAPGYARKSKGGK